MNTAETKLRPATWSNTQTHEAVYGIEILTGGKWLPMGDENGFFMFDADEERDAAMAEHRAILEA
ncbi:hypothetical protein [Desulfoluna sp.]|uniref:hypothetical protein n=1 Tax=Desulfoluna sp. TaxID=2045199 RepID=UPI002625831B|nr:hypothetical protein [Desulfoluna sp.]